MNRGQRLVEVGQDRRGLCLRVHRPGEPMMQSRNLDEIVQYIWPEHAGQS